MKAGETARLQNWCERLRRGDKEAMTELIVHFQDRLERKARGMLRDFGVAGRWTSAEDLLQESLIRLHRALLTVTPTSTRHFFNLAALQMDRELKDLTRAAQRWVGPSRVGREGIEGEPGPLPLDPSSQEPSRIAAWTEFHEKIAALPAEAREVFCLIWYEGLTQAQVAEILDVDVRTVRNRWQKARLALAEILHGQPPA
jgi:RNA polymerase sigma-70 factor (ECF subfamily)